MADRLKQLFPEVEIMFINDRENVPYGSKSAAKVFELTNAAIQPLIEAKCDAIVIACNTATTCAISELRSAYPDIHFVGIEPMIKPAALRSKTGVIAVLATPTTLNSHRYAALKRQWAARLTVLEPDCSNWATLIEHGQAERIDIESVVRDINRWEADVIVLGCTHYHWLKDRVRRAAGPGVEVLEPSDAIGARLDSLLSISSVLPG